MPCYESPEMIAEAEAQAAVARPRVAAWMADLTLRNMLHLEPDAAIAHGGEGHLRKKLECAYAASLRANL